MASASMAHAARPLLPDNQALGIQEVPVPSPA
jgi:hypothetical protein